MDNSVGIVEAALFSAKDFLTVKEISKNTKVPEDEVLSGLKTLKKNYDKRGSAIEIQKTGSGYRMMLRKEYTELAIGFSEVEMTDGQMRTLSLIGYNQPVMQSELCRQIGPRVYDDVRALADLGFISKKPVGQSLELSTTKKFAEYYGISSNRKEDVRKWFEENRKH